MIDFHEVREGALNIPFRQRREPRSFHADLGSYFLDQAEGLDTDQFAFPVKVRGDDDLVGVHSKLLQRRTDLPGGHDLLRLRPDEVFQIDPGPVVPGLRAVPVDDVAPEAPDPETI